MVKTNLLQAKNIESQVCGAALAKNNSYFNKKAFQAIATVSLFIGLTACASTTETANNTPTRPSVVNTNPYKINANNPYTPANLRGQELVRVALLAPVNSTNQGVREEALTLEAAAKLSLAENSDGKTVLFTEDSGATPEEATVAVRNALNKGADFIIGPLFASGITAVAPYARANDATVFSFSTDTSEAGRGVYVLTFLPEDETDRIITYAGSRNIKRLVLLLPLGRYGDRVLAAANAAAAKSGIQIVGTERYDNSTNNIALANAAARRAAALSAGGQRGQTAIFIPERGPMLRGLVQTLSVNGASTSRVRYLGTSLWNDASTTAESRLLGGWFVSPDIRARGDFEKRLQAAANRRPTRLAGFGYDAISIIAKLAKDGEKSQISRRIIENRQGFDGVDGKFRFENGVVNRAMIVNEIGSNGARIIDAPQGFN